MFDFIYNDEEIRTRYKEIENYENLNGGQAYHNLAHVMNVCNIVEKILTSLNYDLEFIENAKIAALLHDTGANEGKEGHAYRSYLFAKDYLFRNDIKLLYENELLETIKIHSDGFDIVECEEYYFTAKIFKAIKSFSKKLNLEYNVMLNGNDWNPDFNS